VDSQRIGVVETQAGPQDVTERRLRCPPPGGCGFDEKEVLVFWRFELFQGTTTKRSVRH